MRWEGGAVHEPDASEDCSPVSDAPPAPCRRPRHRVVRTITAAAVSRRPADGTAHVRVGEVRRGRVAVPAGLPPEGVAHAATAILVTAPTGEAHPPGDGRPEALDRPDGTTGPRTGRTERQAARLTTALRHGYRSSPLLREVPERCPADEADLAAWEHDTADSRAGKPAQARPPAHDARVFATASRTRRVGRPPRGVAVRVPPREHTRVRAMRWAFPSGGTLHRHGPNGTHAHRRAVRYLARDRDVVAPSGHGQHRWAPSAPGAPPAPVRAPSCRTADPASRARRVRASPGCRPPGSVPSPAPTGGRCPGPSGNPARPTVSRASRRTPGGPHPTSGCGSRAGRDHARCRAPVAGSG